MATAATLQTVVAHDNLRWYAGLLKPTFSPSPWLALAATAALACVLAAGFFRVLCRPDYLPDRPAAIRLFLIGVALDVLWSWLFFAGRHRTLALAAAAALVVAAAAATWRCATVDRRAGLWLLPWIPATVFTFLLDLSIALRNG